MPFTEKRLAGPTQLTTSAASLYTVPSSKTTIVKQIVATNTSASAATFSLYIGTATAANSVFNATSVAANDSLVINLSQVLATGEVLNALASANTAINLTISGVENDGPLTPNATYIADGSVTTAKIADGAIYNVDINAAAAIDKTKIAGTAITAADTGTVTSTMILDGTIAANDLANGAVTSAKLDTNITVSGTLKSTTLGVAATTILGTVQVGDSGAASDGSIVIGKYTNAGSNRHFKIGYNAAYDMCIGDYGNNASAGTWVNAIRMPYGTPADTIVTTSAGAVKTPNQPSFFAYRSANYSNTAGTILMDATLWNVSSSYNTSTYLFTAPVAGYYLVVFNTNVYNANGFTVGQIVLKNGSTFVTGERKVVNTAGDYQMSTSVILSLAAGDTTSPYLYTSASLFFSGGYQYNSFAGYLLG